MAAAGPGVISRFPREAPSATAPVHERVSFGPGSSCRRLIALRVADRPRAGAAYGAANESNVPNSSRSTSQTSPIVQRAASASRIG